MIKLLMMTVGTTTTSAQFDLAAAFIVVVVACETGKKLFNGAYHIYHFLGRLYYLLAIYSFFFFHIYSYKII